MLLLGQSLAKLPRAGGRLLSVPPDQSDVDGVHASPVAGTDGQMKPGAKAGWAVQAEASDDVDQAKKEADFHEIKDAIEQIMQYKVVQRYLLVTLCHCAVDCKCTQHL